MKKIIGLIVIGLLCSFTGLYANDDGMSSKMMEQRMNQMLKSFENAGGSAAGVKILKEEFAKMDKQTMMDNRKQMMQLKKEMKMIATDTDFNARAFKNNADKMKKLMGKGMDKFFDNQIKVLSKLSQKDRKIYISQLDKKMSKMHGQCR
ncbi:hypothetical protein HPDP_00158 [Candidatus Hepatincola sp. Pdp]